MNDETSFVSLLSDKYQKNIFLGFTVNHAPWSLTLATESTNSDESLSSSDSNTWNAVALTYRIKSDNILIKFDAKNSLIILDKNSKEKIEKSIKNIPNVKSTDVNHFSAFDIVKHKKLIFTESSIKELEKRYI